jgi:prepilin-type processing-associated H-X9-DG protein
VLDGRPADLLGLPNFKPIAESINTNILNRIEPRWISAEEIARITVYWLTGPNGEQARPGPDPFGPPSGLIVQIRQAKTDLKEHIVKLFGGAEVFSYSGQTYFRSNHPERFSAFTPDDRTIVVANEILLRDLIKAGPNARPRHPWDRAWKEIEQGQFTLGVDCLWFRARVRQMIGINNPAAAATGAFTPLWEKTRALAFGVNALDGLKIDALGICESSEDAKQVGDTLRAVLTLGRNSMQTLHRQARVAPSQTHGRSESLLLLADLIDPLLEKAEVKIEEGKAQSTVRLRSVTEIKVAELARAMMPPVQAARTAARRAQSVNNMKMIGLAFHNYASANNTFPPPAGKGPNSQHPHSWRVDLLPYLEQQELYNQYHFDEPWDGPNNRKLIDKMPVVYRAPGGKESKSQPSYFVFTGPDTLFLGDRGTGFAQITDGTSNTILIVEAERDIPWTKPEDLPYDPRMPLPKLGGYFPGGFNVGMADGSVRFVSDKIDDQVLRALITKAGGEVVSLDRIPNPTQPANR